MPQRENTTFTVLVSRCLQFRLFSSDLRTIMYSIYLDLDRLFSGFCRVLFESRVQGTKSRYQKTFSAWSKWTCFQSWVLKMMFLFCSQNSRQKVHQYCSLAFWHFWHRDSARHQAQRSGQRQVSWETHRPLDLDFWDASKIHSGVQWVWGWWGIDISAHNKGDHSIRKALCLGQFRVIESRVRSRSLIHIAHLHHTCALAKCTHTHTLMTCFSCLSSMFRVTRQNRRFSSLSSFQIPLKKGMLTQAMNHEEMFHELILSEKKTHRNWIRDGRTEDWKQRSLVDGHAPVFMLERSRCCRRKLWPSWPGRCLGLAERDEIQQTHRT